MGNSALKVTRETRPGSTTVGAKYLANPLRSKPEQHAEHLSTFDVDGASGFENEGSEEVRLTSKAFVVLLVLLCLSIVIARADEPNVRRSQRAGDGHIDCETLAVFPDGDGDVARASTRRGAKDAVFLHHRGKHAIGSNAVDEVTNSVVADDAITRPCAAHGVVAMNVYGLHAQRAGNVVVQHTNTQTIAIAVRK